MISYKPKMYTGFFVKNGTHIFAELRRNADILAWTPEKHIWILQHFIKVYSFRNKLLCMLRVLCLVSIALNMIRYCMVLTWKSIYGKVQSTFIRITQRDSSFSTFIRVSFFSKHTVHNLKCLFKWMHPDWSNR